MQTDAGPRKTIIFPDDLWELINDYRFDNRLGTEADAVRTLVQMGLHYNKLTKHPEFAQHEANIIEELNNTLAG